MRAVSDGTGAHVGSVPRHPQTGIDHGERREHLATGCVEPAEDVGGGPVAKALRDRRREAVGAGAGLGALGDEPVGIEEGGRRHVVEVREVRDLIVDRPTGRGRRGRPFVGTERREQGAQRHRLELEVFGEGAQVDGHVRECYSRITLRGWTSRSCRTRDAARGGGEDRRRFRARVLPEQARTGDKTEALWQAVAEPGFLSVHLPEEYGGGGGGMAELAVVSEELATQGCPLLLILVSAGISAEVVARFGTDAQKQRWLPGLTAGEKMVFAITEPDAGSNSHNLSTTATRDGEVYRLRGTKTYISGATRRRRCSSSRVREPTWSPDAARCRCSSSTPTRRVWNGPSSPSRSARRRSSFNSSSTTWRSRSIG